MTDFELLLRKAEMQNKRLELEVQFQKNLELLKKTAPALYNRFKSYEPRELRLSFGSDGEVNLVNFQLDNKPVYAKSPKEFCAEQVANYIQKPLYSKIPFLASAKDQENRFVQTKLINGVLNKYDEEINKKKIPLSTPVGLMLMNGCGMGYQLELLLENMDIQSMCVNDPHPDSFYASLHCIDWSKIFLHFQKVGGFLKFYIGMNENDILADMKTLADKIGLFNLSTTYIYRHFNSDKETEFINLYKKQFHLAATGIGFLEDEQISLSHTIDNLNKHIPVLKASQTAMDLPPAIIVGNGPSLDGLIDTLRENQGKAIIFSCGSASTTLHNYGITPDIHIEMERTSPTADWLKKGTSEEFLKKTVLMALNTVSPNTFELFDKKFMMCKPNDLGTFIIKEEIDKELVEVGFCNPTVTNCGLSAALYLGFRDVYLFGVDLGMIDKEQHHAKGSMYYDLNDKAQTTVQDRYQHNTYKTRGNFRDTVLTNTDFHTSRVNMETLLKLINANTAVNVFNLNDGAYIQGTHPLKQEDLRLPDVTNKKLDKLIASRFHKHKNIEVNERRAREKYVSGFYNIKNKLTLDNSLKTQKEIKNELNRVYQEVKSLEKKDPTSASLLRGSINSFFTMISRVCAVQESDSKRQERYTELCQVFDNFINSSYELIDNNLTTIDKTLAVWE